MQPISSDLFNSVIQLMSATTLNEAYNATLSEALKLTNAQCGSIFSHDENNFHRLYSNVPKEKQATPSTTGLSYQSLKTGETFVHNEQSLQQSHPDLYKKGVKGIIILPLQHNHIQCGILTLQCYTKKKPRNEKLSALKIFGTLAGISIHKSIQEERLNTIVASKDLFMSIASHELKNPITTIKMYVQLIRKKVDKKILPEKKWVDILHSETAQLTELINDLLTKERLSLYEMEYKFQQQDLRKVIKVSLEKYQTTHPERKFIFNDLIPKFENTTLIIDANKIHQVITNILNNAVKFSSSDQPISIALTSSKKYLSFTIEDKGDGIPKKNRKMLFDKFFKGDPDKEGLGLGLYVAKTILDKHHAKIQIKSVVKKGTKIIISLPKNFQ